MSLPGHTITVLVLGNLFALTSNCQMPCIHLIAISNLLCWLPQKKGWKQRQWRGDEILQWAAEIEWKVLGFQLYSWSPERISSPCTNRRGNFSLDCRISSLYMEANWNSKVGSGKFDSEKAAGQDDFRSVQSPNHLASIPLTLKIQTWNLLNLVCLTTCRSFNDHNQECWDYSHVCMLFRGTLLNKRNSSH